MHLAYGFVLIEVCLLYWYGHIRFLGESIFSCLNVENGYCCFKTLEGPRNLYELSCLLLFNVTWMSLFSCHFVHESLVEFSLCWWDEQDEVALLCANPSLFPVFFPESCLLLLLVIAWTCCLPCCLNWWWTMKRNMPCCSINPRIQKFIWNMLVYCCLDVAWTYCINALLFTMMFEFRLMMIVMKMMKPCC